MSSDDADDERESPLPVPVAEWVNPKNLKFTMFVVLPNDEVCTLRELPSGITVFDVKGRLELYAGLPANIYKLIYPDGEELPDDQKLMIQENILHGYVLKVHIDDTWEALFSSVTKNNIEQVYHSGVHLKGNITVSPDDRGRYENMVRERGGAALYIACYLGLQRMVGMLLSVGVDVNTGTVFGRRPIHATLARDHVAILDILNQNGAALMQTDCFGVTPLDIAREMTSALCAKKLRVMLLNLRGNSGSQTLRRRKKHKPAFLPKELRGTESCPPVSDSGNDVSHHEIARTRSTQSQYSEDPTSCRGFSSPPYHKSIKSASSSASSGHLIRKPRVLSCRQQMDKKMSQSHDDHVIQPKRSVKWKDAPSDNAYWNVVELPLPQKDSVVAAVNIQPVAIIKSKKVLKFDKGETKDDDEEGEKHDVDTEAKTLKKEEEKENFEKAVRFTKARLRYFNKMSTVNETRNMRRRINIAVGHRKLVDPDEHSPAFQRWLQKKEDEQEKEDQSDDNDVNGFNVSDSEEDKMKEFNKRVRKMNRETKKHQTPGNRPVPNLISIGSTQLGDGTNPPSDTDHTAYREWRRRKLYDGPVKMERKSIEELTLERKKLEERRQKLLLNAITYDEWMDHAEERKYLIKQILQADYMEMRRLEEERFGERVKLYSFDLWKEKLKKREAEERKRKLIQLRYETERDSERVQFGKSTAAVSFDAWKKKKLESARSEKEHRSKSAKENSPSKPNAFERESAYEKWLERKHNEDMSEILQRSN